MIRFLIGVGIGAFLILMFAIDGKLRPFAGTYQPTFLVYGLVSGILAAIWYFEHEAQALTHRKLVSFVLGVVLPFVLLSNVMTALPSPSWVLASLFP